MALPKGYGGFVFARSGLGIRHGVVPGNCVGVIDADYRGEVLVGLHNHSDTAYTIQPGERIAQLVVLETPMWEAKEVDSLDDTDRGTGGFGSPEADREENALRMKKNLILLFLLLAGVMFGSLLAAATRGIPWLSWLSYGQTVGISVDNPMILDLAVIQLAFGFELGVNIAQIICVLIAIFAYKGLVSRL